MAESAHSRSAGPAPLGGSGPPRIARSTRQRTPSGPVLTSLAILLSGLVLCAGCGPSGVTLLKPSNLVDYQYVTCFPHKDDPGALDACIRYYEERGFVRQDQVNVLQM